jgi:hypothetical protein
MLAICDGRHDESLPMSFVQGGAQYARGVVEPERPVRAKKRSRESAMSFKLKRTFVLAQIYPNERDECQLLRGSCLGAKDDFHEARIIAYKEE